MAAEGDWNHSSGEAASTGANRNDCGLLARGHRISNKVFLCLQTLLSGKAVQ